MFGLNTFKKTCCTIKVSQVIDYYIYEQETEKLLTFYNQLSPKYYILEYVQMPVRLSQVLCKVSRLLPALPHTTLCGCGYPYRTPHYNLTKETIAYRKDLLHIPHFFLPIPHMILVLSPWKNKFFSSIMSVDIIFSKIAILN